MSLQKAIKLLGQGLDVSQQDIDNFDFNFEQLEEPGMTQQMTPEEWQRFQDYQQNPPQTPEEQEDYQMLYEKAQQAVSACALPAKKSRKAANDVTKYDIVNEMYRLQEMVTRAVDIIETSENITWDISKALHPIEASLSNIKQMLEMIQNQS